MAQPLPLAHRRRALIVDDDFSIAMGLKEDLGSRLRRMRFSNKPTGRSLANASSMLWRKGASYTQLT
jgi:hypothetical protein